MSLKSSNSSKKSYFQAGDSLHSSEYSASAMKMKENEETLITNPDEYVIFIISLSVILSYGIFY